MRAAITYPDPPDAYTTADVAGVMRRVGLKEFVLVLDRQARLDKILSLGQQQLIGFARLMLHRPTWVFLDEATSALDELSQRRVMSIFDHELRSASLLSIGHRPGLEAFHTRTLHLVRTPAGAKLYHDSRSEPVEADEQPQTPLNAKTLAPV
jgi:putative ATP-binding cassette transporter